MSYSISLNPKQCHALLQSIVDCDDELYELIKICAKTYSDNPEYYELESNIINWVYQTLCPCDQIEEIHIQHLEFNRYNIVWNNINDSNDYSCIVEYIDENHINRL
jgi:hypothetical protein